MKEPTKAQLFVKNMMWMINSGEEAEAMSNKELAEALCECGLVGQEHVSSLESAVVGEVLARLQHPYTWRLRRCWSKLDAKYHAWKYLRRKK
jgi:hypothetical protein